MTTTRSMRMLATSAVALTLAACGGGSGGGGGGMVSAPPPPTPTPTPTPTPYFPQIFPSITTTTDFAAIGYESFIGVGSSAPQLRGDGLAVRYDAAAGAYIIDLPSAPPGRFEASSETSAFWRGALLDQPTVSPSVDVRKPADAGFVYTTFGDYYQYEWAPVDFFNGLFAFGLSTPVGAVPTTGSASYDAVIVGKTLDWSADIGGTATLQFNFAAGTLAGSLNPTYLDFFNAVSLGRYDFVNTIYSVGSTTFSGGLKHETANLTGSFNGLFTGPQAQELMARWSAQFVRPSGDGQVNEMFGVLVGKRP